MTAIMLPPASPGDKYYIAFKKEVMELTYGTDGLWRSEDGTIFAFKDSSATIDPVDRPGVWPFVMPIATPMDAAAAIHDYMYTCPTYQLFYTREEADKYLLDTSLELATNPIWRTVSYGWFTLVRLFGGYFWENDSTNK